MADKLFGIEVPSQTPEQIPDEVFPYDCDEGFSIRQIHKTIVHPFSPILSQRFSTQSEPATELNISMSVMKGEYAQVGTRFFDLYNFYVNHAGDALPFWWYDPTRWADYPVPGQTEVPYREVPRLRITHPGNLVDDEAGWTNITGLYCCYFEDENLTFDSFAAKLRRTTLRLRGYPVYQLP